MKELTLEIKPKQGLGEISFGQPMDQLVEYLGEAEDVENLEDEEEFSTVILNFYDKGVTAFVEGIEKQVISCFETDNRGATLFGKWVFDMTEEQIRQLMKDQGYSMLDEGMEEWGERRLTYEDGMIDFFFDNEKLTSVNWGVMVNDKGEIEEI
jgi:hypothetical protein